MKKLLLSLFALLSLLQIATAENFAVDDEIKVSADDNVTLTYVITKEVEDDTPGTVKVSKGEYTSATVINIPTTVTVTSSGQPSTEYTFTVTEIDADVFNDCSNITSITLPETLITIGGTAFAGTGITEITIPENVTSIGDWAFSGCSSLKTITLEPKTPPTIASNTFYSIPDDATFYVPGGCYTIYYNSESWSSFNIVGYDLYDGTYYYVFYSENQVEIVYYLEPYSFAEDNKVTIPASTTIEGTEYDIAKIGDNAFHNCAISSIEAQRLEAPELGVDAFDMVSDKPTLTVPEGSEKSYSNAGWTDYFIIDGYVVGTEFSAGGLYYRVTAVQDDYYEVAVIYNKDYSEKGYLSVTIPEEITEETEYFSFMVVYRVTAIDQGAFSNCDKLYMVSIPETVTTIGESAFSGCRILSSINIPSGVKVIEKETFKGCGVTEITFTEGSQLQTIAEAAFSGCSQLKTITIPAGVTSIGYEAFGQTGLETILFDDNSVLQSLDSNVFTTCSSLTSIAIPNTVEQMGTNIFWACSALTNATLPTAIDHIPEGTFGNCTALSEIVIPANVTYLEKNAFGGCSSLKNVTVQSILPAELRSSEEEFAFANVEGAILNVPDGASKLYTNSDWIDFFTIAGSPLAIDGFYYNYLYADDELSLELTAGEVAYEGIIFVPETVDQYAVTSIDAKAFSASENIEAIVMTASTPIAFEGSLNCDLYVPAGSKDDYTTALWNEKFASITEYLYDSNLYFVVTDDESLEVIPSLSETYSGEIVIPSTVNGYTVTAIAENAFANCDELISITIPTTITAIAEGAFLGCKNLTEVTVSSIEPLELSEGVFEVVADAILNVPDGTVNLYVDSAWNDYFTIVGSPLEIDDIYFEYITDGETLSLEIVVSQTPYEGDVVLPATVVIDGVEYQVVSIADDAFADASKITSIEVKFTAPINCNTEVVFANINTETCILIVPNGAIDAFADWADYFSDINDGTVVETPTAIEALTLHKAEVARYNLQGQPLTTPTKGINIIKYSDDSAEKVLVK